MKSCKNCHEYSCGAQGSDNVSKTCGCDCYHTKTERHYLTDFERGVYFANTGKHKEWEEREYSECWGTKECDRCSCGGDRTKCDFYEDVRKIAKVERQSEAEKIELQFYREWILDHDLLFKVTKDYEKWKNRNDKL